MSRRAVARVNLAAVERNCARLVAGLSGGAVLCAVVKADGYGHGAAQCARAAVAGGARRLAVATAREAALLRAEGIGEPILVMGALDAQDARVALAARADVVAWSAAFVSLLRGLDARDARVHVKLDTGMGRLGTRDAVEAGQVAAMVADAPGLILTGVMTHLATADQPGDDFMGEQLARFAAFAAEIRRDHRGVVVHAANSAATLREPGSHFDMVRCGIAIYGMDPFQSDPESWGLEPALELRSYVAAVKPCLPGESAGYGRRFVAGTPTSVAVLPIGYADGLRRGLGSGGEVLIGGRRHPLAGTVSMDSVAVDVGASTPVACGDGAVIVGRQGDERILAEDLAALLGTINYEITCAIGPRVARVHHRDGR